jgi:hypothetical protein
VFYIYVAEQILDSASTFHALIFGFVSCLVSPLLILILLAPRTYALVFPASCVLTEAVGPNVGHIWELVSGASASCVSCLRFSSAAQLSVRRSSVSCEFQPPPLWSVSLSRQSSPFCSIRAPVSWRSPHR